MPLILAYLKKKKDYDAKINEIKGKIPSITAANELNDVEKKIPSVSTLVKKSRLWYKNIKIEKKYFTASDNIKNYEWNIWCKDRKIKNQLIRNLKNL